MTALLSVDLLSKRFGGLTVVDRLSFEVAEGDAVGIVGPNGAGKTTLLNLIAGDLRADSGTVTLDGVDVTRRPAHVRCHMGIGRTSQIPRPFEGLTVFENVLVGSTFGSGRARRSSTASVVEATAVEALERVGMLGRADTPAGALTLLERKRLELARALATEPRLLLLDEIAGGLTEAEVLALVATIRDIRADGCRGGVDRAHRPRPAPCRRPDDRDGLRSQADRGAAGGRDGVRRGALGVPRRGHRGVMSDAGESRMSLLDIDVLDAGYGDFQALFGIDLHVDEAETVSMIGANGAGKSTLLKAIAGMLEPMAGEIRYAGESLAGIPANRRVANGISLVPEGRRIFPSLSVEENLLIGAHIGRKGPWTKQRVMAAFPMLANLAHRSAARLSGGEQQTLAIGRALMANPQLLLLDEVSLGLAPVVVKQVYEAVPIIKAQGTTILIVEQDVNQALKVADRVYCLLEGRISLTGTPGSLAKEDITEAYFGLASTPPDHP